MLTLSPSAKERLEKDLMKLQSGSLALIRISFSRADPKELRLFLDREKKGDLTIKNEKGEKLLLISEDLAPAFDGMILDYGDTPNGKQFTITRM